MKKEKTIEEEGLIERLFESARHLEIKLAQDESDRKVLEEAYRLYLDGKMDRETYEELKRFYNKLYWNRWMR